MKQGDNIVLVLGAAAKVNLQKNLCSMQALCAVMWLPRKF